jgi:hypothetical protein
MRFATISSHNPPSSHAFKGVILTHLTTLAHFPSVPVLNLTDAQELHV